MLSLCFLASCVSSDVTGLLRAPRLSDEQRAIYDALSANTDGVFTLKYPRSGDYRSAFLIQDIDGDPETEALAFIEVQGEDGARLLTLSVLDRDGEGNWRNTDDFTLGGTDVDSVYFSTLSGGRTVFAVTSVLSSDERNASVFRYRGGELHSLLSRTFSYIGVGDFFGTGGEQLLLVRCDSAAKQSWAEFYVQSGTGLEMWANVSIDSYADEITDVTVGKLNDVTTGTMVTFRREATDVYGTDVLVRTDKGIVNVCYHTQNAALTIRRVNNLTELSNPLDINNDGIIELTGTVDFPGYENIDPSQRLRMTVWRGFSMSRFTEKYYGYYAASQGYVFFIPPRWQGNVTARLTDNGTSIEFLKAKRIDEANDVVLKIIVQPSGSPLSDELPDDAFFLGENKTLKKSYYAVTPNHKLPLALTETELKNAFKTLEQ